MRKKKQLNLILTALCIAAIFLVDLGHAETPKNQKKISEPSVPPLASPVSVPESRPESRIDVIFDLKNTFLQQIPARNLDKLDKSKIIEVNNKHYRIAEFAVQAIARLSIEPRSSLLSLLHKLR